MSVVSAGNDEAGDDEAMGWVEVEALMGKVTVGRMGEETETNLCAATERSNGFGKREGLAEICTRDRGNNL